MLKLENISVHFTTTKVLNSIHAQLNKGDFVVIVGPNGAGKSTLLQTIVGSIIPSEGTLWLQNKNITNKSVLQRASYISRVHQDPLRGTISDMTVEENLAIACYKGKKVGLRNAFKQWHALQTHTTLLHNTQFLKKIMHDLSGGQRQLIAFIMATLYPCKILLLDEPTAALDPKSAEQMLHAITEYVQEHQPITLLITHNLDDALRIGNKLWIMQDGCLIKELNEQDKRNLSSQELKKILYTTCS